MRITSSQHVLGVSMHAMLLDSGEPRILKKLKQCAQEGWAASCEHQKASVLLFYQVLISNNQGAVVAWPPLKHEHKELLRSQITLLG